MAEISPRATVSACLIVRDEEERLPAALESVDFCDEVIVVDSGSRDRTVAIARAAGATVLERDWPGYSAQRNRAIDAASGDWILEVDADECLSPRLRSEIQAFLEAPPLGIDMGALPLRQRFLGRAMGPSMKYPAYRYRLFRRDGYRHDEGRVVHEGLWARNPPWAFQGDLVHELAGDWREALQDTIGYARLEASRFSSRPPSGAAVVGIVVRPPAKLVYRLVIDGGWRDGWRAVVRVGLECFSDALVWTRRLRLAPGGADGDGGEGEASHFGHEPARLGAVKLAGIASGEAATSRASRWLVAAADAGADVVLITDAAAAAVGVRLRPVPRLGPIWLARALGAEAQLRPVDALAPVGRRARCIARLMPSDLRGPAAAAQTEAEDPVDFQKRLYEATRTAPVEHP